MTQLHIIEPTLKDQAGHCHGYVQSLIQSHPAPNQLHLWFDKKGRSLFTETACQRHLYFSRRWRKIQTFFCLKKLIKAGETIFIPTAGRLDLIYLHRLLRHRSLSQRPKIFLHFHQFKITAKKTALLKRLAKQHSEWIIMTPTPALLSIFKTAGFLNCECVACPGYAPQTQLKSTESFEKVIYAGAARADKGFPEVIHFLEYVEKKSIDLPLEIQISAPFSGRYDEKIETALKKLRQLSLKKITLHRETLDKVAYQQLFQQAIVLLIYDAGYYHDKFSGVALDAFYAGCPVVATANTWAGEIVSRFQAGHVLTDRSPESILQAVQAIKNNFEMYQQRAKQAAAFLMEAHDPKQTWRVIDQYQKVMV